MRIYACTYISLHDHTMTADPGMTIGLAVVVRELTETGNAAKNGVWLGDEIHQVMID